MAIRVHLELVKLGRIRNAQGDLRICPPAFHDLPMEGLCKMSTFKKARFATGKHTQNSQLEQLGASLPEGWTSLTSLLAARREDKESRNTVKQVNDGS